MSYTSSVLSEPDPGAMMNLVKPFYLGDKIEFSNIFANPIMSGQFRDSTRSDIEFMKSNIRVLRQKQTPTDESSRSNLHMSKMLHLQNNFFI